MKVCILSPFEDSISKQTGGSVRISNLSKGLVSLGNEVVLLIPKFEETSENVDGVKVLGIKGLLPRRLLQILSKFVGADRPTALFFYDPLFIWKSSKIFLESDIIQFEQVSSGALLIPLVSVIFKKPLAFDCHDTFQALRAKNTTILRKLLETSIEKLAYRFADLISVVSEQEKQYLLSLGIGKRRISVIPNGVDTKYFHKSKNKIEDKKKYGFESFQTVVFVGNMSYSPNAEAIQLLSSKIAPKVAEIVKDVKFLVVGKLQEQISLPGIEFTGFVDNLPGFLCCSDVAVAPLLHGSGTRLKILEYFSCGLPVVSTSIGAEGLAVKDGVNIFIENSIEGFSLRIISLLKNRDLSEHVGDSARTLVERSYDWEKISAKLEKSLIALLN